MAMTKKEKTELERLQRELREAKALRFTDLVKPDVAPPERFADPLSIGYVYSVHAQRVEKACSSSIFHGYGWEKTNSQQPIWLYSTQKLALRALRAELERQYAKDLAEIDLKIDESYD